MRNSCQFSDLFFIFFIDGPSGLASPGQKKNKKKRKIKSADISHPKNFADNRKFSADPLKLFEDLHNTFCGSSHYF